MKKYLLLLQSFVCFSSVLVAQNVGIGTVTPNASALLHVDLKTSTTKGFLVTGTFNNSSTLPDLGAGTRMMFYPGMAAFRAGYIDGTQWNKSNVGFYSIAFGINTTAIGIASTAMGFSSTSAGLYSTATGQSTTASGVASTAMGFSSTASGSYSTSMGINTIASGLYSIVTGQSTTASGVSSTAMGFNTKASGDSSIAMGSSTKAIGNSSTAIGSRTTASGAISTAIGSSTIASGTYSIAMGSTTIASGSNSTAMGLNTIASSTNSTAIGNGTTASGYTSIAMGANTTASGTYSTTMGVTTTASGYASTAMGSLVNTNNKEGAFIIGDSDPHNDGPTLSEVPNEFVARFNNGYYLLTSGNTSLSGVRIGHNGNAWVSICDKNRKENFEPLDGDEVLQKIAKINFTSWNYKMQDPKTYRHYGIMAQDFYNAFGHDKFGTIGDDTTVNPIDMIGIDMTAIQALEKRTEMLNDENKELKNEVSELEERLDKLEKLSSSK